MSRPLWSLSLCLQKILGRSLYNIICSSAVKQYYFCCTRLLHWSWAHQHNILTYCTHVLPRSEAGRRAGELRTSRTSNCRETMQWLQGFAHCEFSVSSDTRWGRIFCITNINVQENTVEMMKGSLSWQLDLVKNLSSTRCCSLRRTRASSWNIGKISSYFLSSSCQEREPFIVHVYRSNWEVFTIREHSC